MPRACALLRIPLAFARRSCDAQLRLLTSRSGITDKTGDLQDANEKELDLKITGGENGHGRISTKSTVDNESTLLSAENVKKISRSELARLKTVLRLVKEHVQVVEEGQPPLDSDVNPLIDPRSFNIRTLPRVPVPALRRFREEVTPEVASGAGAVWTREVWEDNAQNNQKNAEGDHKLHGSEAESAAWTAVDERTMDPYYFLRMQRQKLRRSAAGDVATGKMSAGVGTQHLVTSRRRRHCPLSDGRGRVHVDCREVATLRQFIDEHGKILHRRKSRLSAKAQRKVSRAVKTARQMALLHPEPKPMSAVQELREMQENLGQDVAI